MHLREYLFRAKINQTEFAKKVGVSRTHFSLIVLGRKRPSPELAKRIIDETGGRVTYDELFFPQNHPFPTLDENKKD